MAIFAKKKMKKGHMAVDSNTLSSSMELLDAKVTILHVYINSDVGRNAGLVGSALLHVISTANPARNSQALLLNK